MKNYYFIKISILTLILTIFSSCETKESIKSEIDSLRKERTNLQQVNQNLSSIKDSKVKEISRLSEELKELNIYKSGKEPKYILKVQLSQSRFSLDIGEHIKDAMNTIEFEIPVDKDFYNNVSIGTKITDDFRVGSFVMNGSFSNWNMVIINKNIK